MWIKNSIVIFFICLSYGCKDYMRYQDSERSRKISKHQLELNRKAKADGVDSSTNESTCIRDWISKVGDETSIINKNLSRYENPVAKETVAAAHCLQLRYQKYINSKVIPQAEAIARKNNCPIPTKETTTMHQGFDENDNSQKEYLVYTDDVPQRCAWKPAPAYKVAYEAPKPANQVREIDCNRPDKGWEELTCLGSKYDLEYSSPWH